MAEKESPITCNRSNVQFHSQIQWLSPTPQTRDNDTKIYLPPWFPMSRGALFYSSPPLVEYVCVCCAGVLYYCTGRRYSYYHWPATSGSVEYMRVCVCARSKIIENAGELLHGILVSRTVTRKWLSHDKRFFLSELFHRVRY